MSYDIWLEMDTGNGDALQGESQNMTYNVSPMYREAMGISLNDLNGTLAGECRDILRQGISKMMDDAPKYKRLNPPNGWGDYASALRYLQWLLGECCKHPKATVRVC